jgi:hypothetical protein
MLTYVLLKSTNMKFQKIIGFAAIAVLLAASSCRKESTSCSTPAQIIDGGPIAADGCDWMINIDHVNYHVDNLAKQYQVNGMNVWVSYTLDTKANYRCGLAASLMPTVILTCINTTEPIQK